MSADQTWWSRSWLRSVEQRARLDPSRLPRAKRYARRGTVGELQLGPGEIRATVAGRDSRPYAVRIRVRPFSDEEWRQVFEAIAARASHAAALLEGELPPQIAAAVEASGLTLVPGAVEIGPRCTCPDDADPCKHAAAVCYVVADALDADPFAVFLLRGRTREEVLAGLRVVRRDHAAARPDEVSTQDSTLVPDVLERPEDTAGWAAPTVEDPGVDARDVLAATTWAAIPDPPAPPRRPGRPVAWPMDPPQGLDTVRTDLIALAADAVHRAWELTVGAAPDARLALDPDTDLARRAARALGTPALTTLAARTRVPERELTRWALAWRHGGVVGLQTLRTRWNPAEQGEAGTAGSLLAARTALGGPAAGATIRADRVTAARRQLRLGQDYRWYPYQRVHGHWDPAGPAAIDPAVAVARAWPHDRIDDASDDDPFGFGA